MPVDNSPLHRAIFSLVEAISVCPNTIPLRGSLLALLSPFSAHVRDAIPSPDLQTVARYQTSLNAICSFSNEVTTLFSAPCTPQTSAQVERQVATLNAEAGTLHAQLDRTGVFTAFAPSFAQRSLFNRIFSCFSQPPGRGLIREPLLHPERLNYEPMFHSLDAYFACIEFLLGTECKMHYLADALTRFLANAPQTPNPANPPAHAVCPPIDYSRFSKLNHATEEYDADIQKAPVSTNDAAQIRELFHVLRFTGFNFQDKLTFALSPSSIRFPAILGASKHSVLYPGSLQAQDCKTDSLWSMSVVVKVFIPDEKTWEQELAYRQEALRVNTLAHPCVLAVHDSHWPEEVSSGQLQSDVFVIAERLSCNLRDAAGLPAFRSQRARIRVLLDVARALNFMHKTGITFRDISPENVLIFMDGDEWAGCAKVDVTSLLKQALFPDASKAQDHFLYIPPERVNSQDVFFTGDVWSLGILACFLFAGDVPLCLHQAHLTSPEEWRQVLIQTARSWSSRIPNMAVRKAVTEMLHTRPSERPTAATVCSLLQSLVESLNLGGQVHEEVIGGENHGDGNIEAVVLGSSNGLGIEAVESTSEDLGVAPKHPGMPSRQTRGHIHSQTKMDPNWSAENGQVHLEMGTSNSNSAVDVESSRNRGHPRESRQTQRERGYSSEGPEPNPQVEDVHSSVLLRGRGQGASNVHFASARDRIRPLSREELFIPPTTHYEHNPEKARDGSNPLGRSRSRSSDGTANGRRRLASTSGEEDALFVSPHIFFESTKCDPTPQQRAEAEKQNLEAEAILESCTPGRIGSAASLFKLAAESGSPKAQVNYGHCLEQGRGVPQDYCEAACFFQKAADQGDARGQFKIGLCHELGRGTKKDFKVAVQWYLKSADQGDSKAQANLGMALEHGRGVKRDLEKAIEYYRKAAQAGNSVAQLNLGVMFENGRGLPANHAAAVALYEKAANGGNNRAMLNLAFCFERGRGVEKDMAKAALMFIRAADAGNAEAKFRAGQCFENGTGVRASMIKAATYYKGAAEQDHIAAMYHLGVLFLDGRGLSKDESKAFKLFKAASEQSHAAATFKLAACYEKGKGVKKSPTLAVNCYKQAAQRGNPAAKVALGYMYENGEGVKKSSQDAVRMYRQAAAVGNAAGEAALGQCHYFAYGMPKNLAEAIRLFESASQKGNADACLELGALYRDGVEVEQNFKKAFNLFKRGAETGNATARVHLGECYYYGRGIEKDYTKAVGQFVLAADQKQPEAYRWLGDCYVEGHGVELDINKAAEFFQKGASAGSTCAMTNLGCCYERGQGVEVHGQKAFNLYRKAADKMNTTAMNNLGILYEKGMFVKQDYSKAFKWYSKAVENEGAEALCNLADCYAEGNGVEKNMVTAVKYYKEGTANGLPEARCELGICYYYGKGVEIDYGRALELWHEASKAESEALRYLGVAHYDGDAVPQDDKKAMEYYLKAAEQGNTDAHLEIGMCFEHGHGVEKDCTKAVVFYQKAADGGNMSAMRSLGNLYFLGHGVEVDQTKAVALFEKAASLKWEDVGR